jgi:hypothetical protein
VERPYEGVGADENQEDDVMVKKHDRDAIAAEIARRTGKDNPTVSQSAYAYTPAPSRRGRAALTTYHDPAVLQQLREISVHSRLTQQRLVAEALNHIFEKYGRPKIAD